MFAEFLKNHPMESMLAGGTRTLYPAAADRRAWDRVPEEYRSEICRMAKAYAEIPYPARTATGFLAFVRDGDRQAVWYRWCGTLATLFALFTMQINPPVIGSAAFLLNVIVFPIVFLCVMNNGGNVETTMKALETMLEDLTEGDYAGAARTEPAA